MSAIRQIQARRIERLQQAQQTRIRRPLTGPDYPFSFRCRIEGDQVRVWKGYRQRETDEPVLCAPGAGNEFSFTWVEGQSIYTIFTYAISFNTKGAFDSTLQCGVAPASSTAQRVFILATMITTDGVPDLDRRWTGGDITVRDMVNCGSCA